MMKTLWTYMDKQALNANTKYTYFLLLFGAGMGFAGLVLWLMNRSVAFGSWTGLFCFAGYPIVLSWHIVFFYACRHPFHDGACQSVQKKQSKGASILSLH